MNKTQACKCTDCKCDPCNCQNMQNCCQSNKLPGIQKTLSIILVVILIGGAYMIGAYTGKYNNYTSHSEMSDKNQGHMMQMSNMENGNSMTEHCKMMPEMAECKNSMTHDMMSMSMNDMGKMLVGKTGDDLNKAFLEGMIPHHQGAVEMAKYLEKSNKPELVKLGTDIIAAQTMEINQMKQWMKDWGYEKK